MAESRAARMRTTSCTGQPARSAISLPHCSHSTQPFDFGRGEVAGTKVESVTLANADGDGPLPHSVRLRSSIVVPVTPGRQG
jgi:hypothetical protein